jgi:predicted esterase
MAACLPKIRVLCLHGFTQNARIMKMQTGALRKRLRKHNFEFIFVDGIDAPLDAPLTDPAAEDQKCWWDAQMQDDGSWKYLQWDKGLNKIKDAWMKHQPAHGILGFSQGAAALALALLEHEKSGDTIFPGLKFAMLFSGFVPRNDIMPELLKEVPLKTPAVNIWGENDRVVDPNKCADLSKLFYSAASITHPGGHYCCAKPEIITEIIDFLEMAVPELF